MPVSTASLYVAASASNAFSTLPHVELYPPAKKPKVVEKSTNSPMLPCDVSPQKRSALSAEQVALMHVTVVAEREKYLFSHSQPKKTHAMMPGALNSVRSRVADVWDRSVTSWA